MKRYIPEELSRGYLHVIDIIGDFYFSEMNISYLEKIIQYKKN